MFGAEFWVAVAFFIFLGILGYFGVHRKLLAGIDARGEKIAAQLAEAQRLRAEAAALLKSYEAKRAAAEKEAAEIVAAAEAEARRVEADAKVKLDEFIKRRTAQAELKISQAEAQATAEVRGAAVELATQAAARILGTGTGEQAFASGLAELKAKLNEPRRPARWPGPSQAFVASTLGPVQLAAGISCQCAVCRKGSARVTLSERAKDCHADARQAFAAFSRGRAGGPGAACVVDDPGGG